MAVLVLPALTGCQSLREISSLRQVDFALDRVSGAQLAGIDLERVRSYNDLTGSDLLRIGRAVSRNEMPFQFTVHVSANNPEENQRPARMVAFDWTLLLDEQETIAGTFNETVRLPAGEVVDVPLRMELDLLNFFERSSRDLVALALAVAGAEGASSRIQLRARPSIDTPIGPIRYPNDITIVSRDVGTP
jgi:hypothetical protein